MRVNGDDRETKNHSAWTNTPHTPNPTLQVKYVLTNNFLTL